MNITEAIDILYNSLTEDYKYSLTNEQRQAFDTIEKALIWQPMVTAPAGEPLLFLFLGDVVNNGEIYDDHVFTSCSGMMRRDDCLGWQYIPKGSANE